MVNHGDLLAGDAVADRLGVELVESRPDRVVLTLTVDESMLNLAGTCHGGVMFTLADIAMSLVSNATSSAFATGADMSYVSPAHAGDILVATVAVRHQRGKVTHHEGEITCGDTVVALFNGATLTVS